MRALHLASVTAVVALATSGFALAGLPAYHAAHNAAHRAPHHAVVKHRVARRPVAAKYAGFVVPMDEARVITFTQPIATVFVGNSMIADVTMIDSRHAYVLGKVFGATNVIGLDHDHNQIVNQPVTVANRMTGEVTLTRGADSYNYSCTQYHCETNPRPGDPETYSKNTEDATSMHQELATKAAGLQSPAGSTGSPQ